MGRAGEEGEKERAAGVKRNKEDEVKYYGSRKLGWKKEEWTMMVECEEVELSGRAPCKRKGKETRGSVGGGRWGGRALLSFCCS